MSLVNFLSLGQDAKLFGHIVPKLHKHYVIGAFGRSNVSFEAEFCLANSSFVNRPVFVHIAVLVGNTAFELHLEILNKVILRRSTLNVNLSTSEGEGTLGVKRVYISTRNSADFVSFILRKSGTFKDKVRQITRKFIVVYLVVRVEDIVSVITRQHKRRKGRVSDEVIKNLVTGQTNVIATNSIKVDCRIIRANGDFLRSTLCKAVVATVVNHTRNNAVDVHIDKLVTLTVRVISLGNNKCKSDILIVLELNREAIRGVNLQSCFLSGDIDTSIVESTNNHTGIVIVHSSHTEVEFKSLTTLRCNVGRKGSVRDVHSTANRNTAYNNAVIVDNPTVSSPSEVLKFRGVGFFAGICITPNSGVGFVVRPVATVKVNIQTSRLRLNDFNIISSKLNRRLYFVALNFVVRVINDFKCVVTGRHRSICPSVKSARYGSNRGYNLAVFRSGNRHSAHAGDINHIRN